MYTVFSIYVTLRVMLQLFLPFIFLFDLLCILYSPFTLHYVLCSNYFYLLSSYLICYVYCILHLRYITCYAPIIFTFIFLFDLLCIMLSPFSRNRDQEDPRLVHRGLCMRSFNPCSIQQLGEQKHTHYLEKRGRVETQHGP